MMMMLYGKKVQEKKKDSFAIWISRSLPSRLFVVIMEFKNLFDTDPYPTSIMLQLG